MQRPVRLLHGLLLAAPLALGLGARALATTAGPTIELSTPAAAQRAPSLSFDPAQGVYVVVWEDARSSATNGVDLYIARIGSDGALLDAAGIPLLEASVLGGDETQPAIVYSATAQAHAIAWTESRAGFPDVFVTRFFATSGSIVPSAGVPVSSGNDAEGFPSIAAGAETYLVAFQTNPVGGGRRIEGRRMYPDTSFLDAVPVDLAGSPSAGSPKTIARGNTFAVGWEDAGDLFARTLPDLGAIGAPAPSVLTAQAGSQGPLSLAPLGLGNILAVWEDARGADDDLYGARFTLALAPAGQEIPVSRAAGNEQRPIAAGGETGALVVWQDRRNGAANGIIYGARLDATGAVLDPAAFPILAFNQNAFEHTVVKGPGADYLVAAVRFDVSAPRIFFRVVRDEAPSGTLTPTGSSSAPADGVTTLALRFGPATGADGTLLVVDGTPYTVTVSHPGAVLGAPDADPARPGHQIGAVDGAVHVSLTSFAHGPGTVSVASVEGNSTGQAPIEFTNVPPVASNVVLAPAAPRSDQDLTLTYRFFDVNGDLERGTLIQWTRNSAIQSAYANQTRVPSAATRRSDQWRAQVTPGDGLPSGSVVFSNTVIVGNTPPAAAFVRIDPSEDVRTGTRLLARYNFEDVDQDAEGPSVLIWYDRGVEQPALLGVEEIPAPMVVKGQAWRFTIRPHDGFGYGELASSSTVAVLNTTPVANAGENGSVLERRTYVLDGRASSDIDPADRLRYAWTQVQGPEVPLSSTSSAAPSFLAPSVRGTTILHFDLVASDGDASSPADRVVVEIRPVPDTDGDGLDEEEEESAGTDPSRADTDRDSAGDAEEVAAGLDPLDEDTDDDGVRDGAEGAACSSCPPLPFEDEDGDGSINALDPDSDGDGLFDGTELGVQRPLGGGGAAPFAYAGTDEARGRFAADLDPSTETSPVEADTDLDTLDDGEEDANRNGRVDDGESDPNDPTDPGIACTAGGSACPPGLACGGGGLCVRAGGDAGLSCAPLAENLECCAGGCTGGTPVEPMCAASGREQCPVGSSQCVAGSCGGPVTAPVGSGCSCRTEEGAGGAGSLAGIALALLLALRSRRRT